jgi:hypothetical protein
MGKIGVYSRIFTLLRFLAETTETEKKTKKKKPARLFIVGVGVSAGSLVRQGWALPCR